MFINDSASGRNANGMFSIQELRADLPRQGRQPVQRAIEMGDHAVARHREQRIGLAGTDDDPAGAELTGAADELNQEIEGVRPHFLGGRGDIHVDIRHVDGHQPQPRFAEIAQAAERRGVEFCRPEMARKKHQFDPAVTLVRESRDGVGGAAAKDVGVCVHAKARGCVGHACPPCRAGGVASVCAR
jgi:hypothetical protein